MTTQTLTPTLDAAARSNRIARTAVFVASAILMYGAVEDRHISLAIIGALFLIASAVQLFRKVDQKPSKLLDLFARHARRINVVMFAGSAALVWSAIQEQKSFAAVGGALLLVAIAYDLFRKKSD